MPPELSVWVLNERFLAGARVEEAQARVAAEVARVQAEHRARPLPEAGAPQLPRHAFMRERRRVWPWRQVAGAVLVLGVLGAGVLVEGRKLKGEPTASVRQEEARNASAERDGGMVGVGATALAASTTAAPLIADEGQASERWVGA